MVAYLDILRLDEDGQLVYGPKEASVPAYTLLQRRKTWQDSARLLGFLVEQQRLLNYTGMLRTAQMAIEHVQERRAGRRPEWDFWGSSHPEIKRLDDGEDPLAVIASILAPPESDRPLLKDPPPDR